jgi:c-di-GMP-binding flagellar brake protein YcgR
MTLKLFGFPFRQSQKLIVKRSADDRMEFVSSLENINATGIHIALPILNLKPMPLLRGETVHVLISLPSSSIEFKTTVKGFKKDNIQLVVLEHPQDYKRVQRRNSVRLKVLMDAEMALLPVKRGQEPEFSKCEMVDISAGGMELVTKLPVERDSTILIKFDLEMEKDRVHNFLVRGKVRRVTPIPPKAKRLGVQFINLSMADADRIVQYIFKRSTTALK